MSWSICRSYDSPVCVDSLESWHRSWNYYHIPLLDKARKLHNNKWESKDTISTYISRLRDLYLALENTPHVINRDPAVHILIDGLPDCYHLTNV
jgi:hypothetical protein